MAYVTRSLSVTYAGVTVGGASTIYHLHGAYTQREDYDKTEVSFQVVCRGDSDATFAANCLALEAAFRTPRGALVVALGAATLKSLSHALSTGYNGAPGIAKQGGDFDSGRARLYQCSFACERPADLAGQEYRRTSTVSVTTEPGTRRALSVSGRYTANGGTTARAQYLASVDAYLTAITSSLGGVWQRIGRSAAADDANKNLDFTESWEEIAIDDGDPGRNVTMSTLVISRDLSAPGDFDDKDRPVSRLQTVRAEYDGWADVKTSNPAVEWDENVKPWIARCVAKAFGAATMALTDQSVRISPLDGHITASMTYLLKGKGNLIEYQLNCTVSDETGKSIVPAWAGNVYSAFVFTGPAQRIRTVTEHTREIAGRSITVAHYKDVAGIDVFKELPVYGERPNGDRWVTLSRNVTESRIKVGALAGNDFGVGSRAGSGGFQVGVLAGTQVGVGGGLGSLGGMQIGISPTGQIGASFGGSGAAGQPADSMVILDRTVMTVQRWVVQVYVLTRAQ